MQLLDVLRDTSLTTHIEVKDMESHFHEYITLWAKCKGNALFFGLKNTMSGVYSCIAGILKPVMFTLTNLIAYSSST